MAIYCWNEGLLVLRDPALPIDYTETFLPPLLPTERRQGAVTDAGFTVQVHSDGINIYAYGLTKDGKHEGEYLFVYPDNSVRGRQYYLNGSLHGPAYFYTNAGQLVCESWFWHGKQEGKALTYYADGTLCSYQHYLNGQRHHSQQYYYPDGTLKTLMHYLHGKLHGQVELYHPDGTLERQLTFAEGQMVASDIRPPHPQPLP